MTQQTAETIVRYRVDQSSVQAAVAANEQVEFSYADMKAAADSVGLSVEELAKRTGMEVVESGQQIVQSNNRVADSYRQVSNEASKASLAQRASGAIGSARQVAGMAGGLLSTVGLGQVGSAASSILGLTSAFGPLGIAMAGATALIAVATNAEEERTRAIEAQTKVLQDQAELVKSGKTTSDVQQEISNLEAGRKVIDDFMIPLLGIQDRLRALIPNMGAIGNLTAEQIQERNDLLAQASEITGVNIYNQAELNRVVNDNLDVAAGYTKKIDELSTAMDRGIFATNDATAAAEAFQDSLQDGVKGALDDAAKAADDVRKRFEDAQTEQYDAFLEAQDLEAKAREELAQTMAKIDEILADRDEKLAQLATDNTERRAEIEADAQDKITQIIEDSQEKIYKIYRDAGREQQGAIAARDALALYQSKLRQQDALEDQRKADAKAIDQTNKAMAKQLDAQQKGYDRQVANTNATYAKQLAIQQNAQAQQTVDLNNAVAARLNIEQNLNSGLYGMQVAHMNAMIGVAYQGGLDIVSAFRSAIYQGLAAGGLGGGAGGTGTGIGAGLGAFGPQQSFNRMFDNRFEQTFNIAAGFK